jgi:small subunit ribosomal protein S18
MHIKEEKRMSDQKFKNKRFRRKVCSFCVDKVTEIDYKDTNKLRRYISESGKMLPRRMTGVCAKHQRMLSMAIKNARKMALIPYAID